MSDSVRIYDFNLPANGVYQLPAVGEYFRILSATGLVGVKLDSGPTVEPIGAGQGLKGVNFGGLTIVDKSGAPNSGAIIVTSAEFIDVNSVGSFAISNTTGPFVHSAVAVANAAGGVQLLAAKATRRVLIIQNNSAIGTIWVRLDGGVPAAGVGVQLLPGDQLNLENYCPSGAIRAIGDQPNNPDVSVVEG